MNTQSFANKAFAFSLFVLSLMLFAYPMEARSQDRVILGVGAGIMPVYQGAGDYRVMPLPVIDIKHGRFFTNLRNGIGFEPIRTENITIGSSIVFVPGYRNRDVPDGIDSLSSGVGGRLFADIQAGGSVVSFGVVKVVSGGTEGVIADARISYPFALSSRFSLTPTLATTWANARYNDRYFGITAAESAASGLPQFSAGSGFKDISALLTASYRMTDRITLSMTGSMTSLLGEVNDSPLVEDKTQPFGMLTLNYRM
ncbi:MipA/OmpV family protein [Vreelandella olivaria]|uniref:MipA/OmpV family protein n=1 Tax=Vreelandella olivaria TaxID=390919 RepID=UPI00201F0EDD|nr:MipA/OmpV family protein [Halomonas olivaria]